MDRAGISVVLMLTSGGLKAVCMQDVLLGGLCSWLHKKNRFNNYKKPVHCHTHG